jgi:hypothetical protein
MWRFKTNCKQTNAPLFPKLFVFLHYSFVALFNVPSCFTIMFPRPFISMGKGALPPGIKELEREAHYSPISSDKIRLNGIYKQKSGTEGTQEVLGRTNRILPLIRHGPHRKRQVQQFVYGCVCIRYHGKVFSEPLPSNDMGIHIQTQRLMGGIYEVRR